METQNTKYQEPITHGLLKVLTTEKKVDNRIKLHQTILFGNKLFFKPKQDEMNLTSC